MKKAHKMYLLSTHQLNRLTQPERSIRQQAESDLDVKMREILDERGLNAHEKIKKYNTLLQRYLNLIKQGQKDEKKVTVTLQRDPGIELSEAERSEETTPEDSEDMMGEVVKSLAPRDRKNAEYIMRKLTESDEGWTSKGEFIYKGTIVKGSHMIDLFKNLMQWSKKSQARPPAGWKSFLNTLAETNVPLSSIRNPRARDQYQRLKLGEEALGSEERKTRKTSPRICYF